MRKPLVLALIAAALLSGVVLASLAYRSWYLLGEHESEVRFEVVSAPVIGFNAGTDMLHFGRVTPGGSATREVLLSAKVPARATITVSPEIAGWLSAQQVSLDIVPGETARVQLLLSIPEDAREGSYVGTVTVRYTRR